MSKSHNEDTRVKIPGLVHLTRLGYSYLSIKNHAVAFDPDTNIAEELFRDAMNRINHTALTMDDTRKIIADIKIELYSDDLGRKFYHTLLNGYNGLRLIDFDMKNGANNSFYIATELTCKNGEDEFRPDITIFVNGLPLAFVEVKKPNNKEGIKAEHDRMERRGQNKKFRRFLNIMQLMVFSNNSEYDDTETSPLTGAFYATTSYSKLFFNRFREELDAIYQQVEPIDETIEQNILRDTNHITMLGTQEYTVNSDPMSPTNHLLTSLFSKERLLSLLQYSIAYVEKTNDTGITTLEKHIMRYPQFFATKAIESRLNKGEKHGIIWHTQGSGKTALAYYNVPYLRDYYQKQGIIAQFYFVVDRLDLLTQAADEFRARGLHVDEVNSREAFIANIKSTGQANSTGQDSITVVNIQKFSAQSVAKQADYNVNVQRIYFMDEAHRSYNPTGSFLANLIASDRNAVMIALTGTPLIGGSFDTKGVFGPYFHKYYYNRSIADGYTLKLIREGITTTYRQRLKTALDQIETIKGSLPRKELYAHPKYVAELVDYITEDFRKSKLSMGDPTIGGMIVCDSSEQARAVFQEMKESGLSSALILHDEDDVETRRNYRNEFKKGTIDFLIVYNMLLTGFDAPRLKKLYLGRVIRDHSLLQALTRVNRPYKAFRYGYVVDFADIRKEFDKTNKAYFDELQSELGDAFKQYDNIFKSVEEIEDTLARISERLFLYDTQNAEIFSQQISALDNKGELLELRETLECYKELFNLSKLFGYENLADKFELENINALYTEVCNRIALINLKKTLDSAEDMSAVLNLVLDEIEFDFKKVSEDELVIADGFRDALDKTHREMQRNMDGKDPEYITLLEELQRLLKKKNIEELTADEMKEHMRDLDSIRRRAAQKNLADQMLAHKYEDDSKFMRTHKRIMEAPPPIATDLVLHKVLLGVKHQVDNSLFNNQRMIENEAYFTSSIFPVIVQQLRTNHVSPTPQQVRYVGQCIATEYISERTGTYQ